MSIKGAVSQLMRLPAGRRFERATWQPEAAQWSKLQQILTNNAQTEFGRQHGFEKIRSVADYQKAVPIRTHEALRPWVDRMTQGEKNVLTYQDPIYYCVTSGSAGAPKPSPITPDYRDEYQTVVHAFLYYVYKEHPNAFNGNALYFNGSAEKGKMPSGVPYGTMSGFNSKNLPPLLKKFYAVPYEAMTLEDSASRYFSVALLALAKPVSMMLAITASPLILFGQTLQNESEKLIKHLHDGTLPADIVLTESERKLITSLQKPHPKRARELSALLERTGKLDPKAIWPLLDLMVCWKSSTAGSLLPELESRFPGVTVRDAIYSATEGWCNVPYSDKVLGGPLAVHAHFYEFIDAEDERPDAPVKLVQDLQPGRQYRILYTTSGGMYRYDIGDILQVSHLYHNTPSVYFARKTGQFSNLVGERLDAEQVVTALNQASQTHNTLLPFYALVPDPAGYPPHYRLYLELPADSPDSAALGQQLATAVDAALQANNAEYRAKRNDRQLAPPVPWLLPSGSLLRWRAARVKQGADEAQIKPPGLILDPAALDFLEPRELTHPEA